MILLFLIQLCIVSIIDIKTNKVPIIIIAVMLVVGIINTIFFRDNVIISMTGVIPGLIFLAISFFSKQQIGYGDALIICIMGLYLSIDVLCATLMMAFTFAGVLALGLMVLKHSKRNMEIAFTPFLILGYGIMRALL